MDTIHKLDSGRGWLREGRADDQVVILDLIREYFACDEIEFNESRVAIGLKKTAR